MNRDIDKILRDKLYGIEQDYPTDMWAKIDREINPPLKKNRWFLFGLSGLALVMMMGGGFFFFSAPSSENASLSPLAQDHELSNGLNTTISDQQLALSKTAQEHGNLIPTRHELVTKNQLTNTQVTDLTIAQAQLAHESINERVQNLKEETENDQANFVNPQTEKYSTESPLALSQESTISQERAVASNGLNDLSAIDTPFDESRQTQNNNKQSFSTKNVAKAKTQALSHKTITFIEPLLEASSKRDARKTSGNTVLLTKPMRLDALSISGADQSGIGSLGLKMEPTAFKSSTNCPSWVKEKLGFYMEVYFTPEYGIRSLTAKNRDSLTVVHQIQRNQTEAALMSYSFGARVLFLTPSGISFKTGVNYSQINERFSYFDPNANREFTETNTETGEIINQWTQYGEETVEKINRYKSIDIPILIGFEKYQGSKFSFSTNAGVYFNFYAQQRGMFITPEGDYEWFTSDQNGAYRAYKNGLGISFYGSIGMMYHWVDGIDFFAEPSLRYYSQSFTLEDYPLRQNFAVFGLQTGARLRF